MSSATQSAPAAAALASELDATGAGTTGGRRGDRAKSDRWHKPRSIVGKTILWIVAIAFALLFVQGLSELIKRIAVMRGLIPDPHATQVHALEAEVEHLVEAIEKR